MHAVSAVERRQFRRRDGLGGGDDSKSDCDRTGDDSTPERALHGLISLSGIIPGGTGSPGPPGDERNEGDGGDEGGDGNADRSRLPFNGGRSWNMKSHFHRSEGFDACSHVPAETGRAKVRAVMPATAGASAKRAAMS